MLLFSRAAQAEGEINALALVRSPPDPACWKPFEQAHDVKVKTSGIMRAPQRALRS